MEAAETAVIQEAFEQSTKVAQIFSGIFFAGLSLWLSVSNSTKLAFVQKAALEKRLTVCCYLNIYVGMFSAFFNFFQLTDVDDVILPEQNNFNFDVSRPIEWICTCPLMQLSLVLLGGSKIPEYRRYMMPTLSVTILILGSCGVFLGANNVIIKIACFVCGLSLYFVMTYFNRKQIIEYSGGEEGVLWGDSEFRKATVLLIATWTPFPVWYCLSPEGFGVISNVLVVQVGWAFLNIVSKFTFIFYIQRIKDMYCNRQKTKRELCGSQGYVLPQGPAVVPQALDDLASVTHIGSGLPVQEQVDTTRKKGQLSAVVIETMGLMGMAQHTERFLKLLDQAEVTNVGQVTALTKEQCVQLHLPFDVVSALQRRLRVWSLEMVDDTEMCLDQGEVFYMSKCTENPWNRRASLGAGAGAMQLPGQAEAQDTTVKVSEIHEIIRNKFGGADDTASTTRSTEDDRTNSKVEAAVEVIDSRVRSFEKRMDEKFSDFVVFAQQVNLRTVASIEQALAAFMAQAKELSDAADPAGRPSYGSDASNALAPATRGSVAQVLRQAQALAAKVDALQATQATAFAEGQESWRLRCDELETAVMCRFEEQEATHKRRLDELLRVLPVEVIEDLASQVQRASEKTEQASTGFVKELQSTASKLTQRMESLHATTGRQVADVDAQVRRCFEDTMSRMALTMETLDQDIARRLDDAVAAPAGGHMHMQTDRRVEKAIETLQAASRGEMQAMCARLLDRVEDLETAILSKACEREDQSARRVEERLEEAATRNLQKTEAVGMEVKKELHGFAKRLNTKIPFM